MKRYAMAVALVATLLMTGAAQAVTVTWVGDTDTWRGLGAVGGAVWDDGSPGDVSAATAFGSSHGWDFPDTDPIADMSIVIDGPLSHVFYDQSIGTGGDRDFRFRPRASIGTSNMTISGGASFSMETDDTVDPDGQWTQFNGDLLTITGAGSLMRRGFGGSGFPDNQSGGKMQLRGIRSEPTGTTEMLIADGGRFENDGGQFNFGDFGRDHIDSTVKLTIDGFSSLDSKGGANFDYLGGILGGGGNGSIMLFRGWDPTAAGGTGGITDEDYSFDFTGHGGTINVDAAGILVVQQIGPDGGADYDFGSLLTVVTYEQLWSGLDRGAAGASIEDIPAGMLSASGKSGATGHVFGDHFITSGTAGTDDYKLTNIQEGVIGGAFEGDISGDGLVNAVDAGPLFANFGLTGGTLAQGNIDPSGIDEINAVDAGTMFANWTGDPGPSGPGNAVAEYDYATGEIIVSMDGVNNWFVRSASFGLTADNPSHTPIVPGSLASDNNEIIGETGFSPGTGTDVSLGFVAEVGLPLGDLTLSFVAGLGTPEVTVDVVYVNVPPVPEPTTLVLAAFGLCGVLATRRRRVA